MLSASTLLQFNQEIPSKKTLKMNIMYHRLNLIKASIQSHLTLFLVTVWSNILMSLEERAAAERLWNTANFYLDLIQETILMELCLELIITPSELESLGFC